jgi:glycosyltransferase involved in cell wall biosynthesis
MTDRKRVTIVTPCYNEELNVRELHRRTRAVMDALPQYEYHHIFIDNASRDSTVAVLREMAAEFPEVQVIVNARNFGHIRSPMHAFLEADGDAMGFMCADLQEPPELFTELLARWEEGFSVVAAIKTGSQESGAMYAIRTAYYNLIGRLTDVKVMSHFTGFGIYDRRVVEILKARFRDPYPYFRGMIAEIGFPHVEVPYTQAARLHGLTKNNFYTLYDLAMLGITNLSKVPLRLVTAAGFISAAISMILGFFYLLYKIVFWNSFSLGVAPLVLGLFFLGSVQLLCLGIIGEYVGSIHTFVQNRPLVIEKERINFPEHPSS